MVTLNGLVTKQVASDDEHGDGALKPATPAKSDPTICGEGFVPAESSRKRIRVDIEHVSWDFTTRLLTLKFIILNYLS